MNKSFISDLTLTWEQRLHNTSAAFIYFPVIQKKITIINLTTFERKCSTPTIDVGRIFELVFKILFFAVLLIALACFTISYLVTIETSWRHVNRLFCKLSEEERTAFVQAFLCKETIAPDSNLFSLYLIAESYRKGNLEGDFLSKLTKFDPEAFKDVKNSVDANNNLESLVSKLIDQGNPKGKTLYPFLAGQDQVSLLKKFKDETKKLLEFFSLSVNAALQNPGQLHLCLTHLKNTNPFLPSYISKDLKYSPSLKNENPEAYFAIETLVKTLPNGSAFNLFWKIAQKHRFESAPSIIEKLSDAEKDALKELPFTEALLLKGANITPDWGKLWFLVGQTSQRLYQTFYSLDRHWDFNINLSTENLRDLILMDTDFVEFHKTAREYEKIPPLLKQWWDRQIYESKFESTLNELSTFGINEKYITHFQGEYFKCCEERYIERHFRELSRDNQLSFFKLFLSNETIATDSIFYRLYLIGETYRKNSLESNFLCKLVHLAPSAFESLKKDVTATNSLNSLVSELIHQQNPNSKTLYPLLAGKDQISILQTLKDQRKELLEFVSLSGNAAIEHPGQLHLYLTPLIKSPKLIHQAISEHSYLLQFLHEELKVYRAIESLIQKFYSPAAFTLFWEMSKKGENYIERSILSNREQYALKQLPFTEAFLLHNHFQSSIPLWVLVGQTSERLYEACCFLFENTEMNVRRGFLELLSSENLRYFITMDPNFVELNKFFGLKACFNNATTGVEIPYILKQWWDLRIREKLESVMIELYTFCKNENFIKYFQREYIIHCENKNHQDRLRAEEATIRETHREFKIALEGLGLNTQIAYSKSEFLKLFRKWGLIHHPDKDRTEGAKERFQAGNEHRDTILKLFEKTGWPNTPIC